MAAIEGNLLRIQDATGKKNQIPENIQTELEISWSARIKNTFKLFYTRRFFDRLEFLVFVLE